MDVRSQSRSYGLAIVGVVVAASIGGFLMLDHAGRTAQVDESVANACREAQVAVEDKLRARGLSFATDCDESSAKKQPAGNWAVVGKVEDQTGKRWLWFVKLTYTGGGGDWTKAWRVDDVEIAPTASQS